MPQVYIHYLGMSHVNNFLKLEVYIKEKDKGMAALNSKQCPNCGEPNKPNIKFCTHCRMALTYDAYNEIIEEKQINDKEMQNLKNRWCLCRSTARNFGFTKTPCEAIASIEVKLCHKHLHQYGWILG